MSDNDDVGKTGFFSKLKSKFKSLRGESRGQDEISDLRGSRRFLSRSMSSERGGSVDSYIQPPDTQDLDKNLKLKLNVSHGNDSQNHGKSEADHSLKQQSGRRFLPRSMSSERGGSVDSYIQPPDTQDLDKNLKLKLNVSHGNDSQNHGKSEADHSLKQQSGRRFLPRSLQPERGGSVDSYIQPPDTQSLDRETAVLNTSHGNDSKSNEKAAIDRSLEPRTRSRGLSR